MVGKHRNTHRSRRYGAIIMLFCIPGALGTKWMCNKVGIRRQLGIITYAHVILNLVIAAFVYKPGMFVHLAVIAVLFGLTIGGNYRCGRGRAQNNANASAHERLNF